MHFTQVSVYKHHVPSTRFAQTIILYRCERKEHLPILIKHLNLSNVPYKTFDPEKPEQLKTTMDPASPNTHYSIPNETDFHAVYMVLRVNEITETLMECAEFFVNAVKRIYCEFNIIIIV